LPLIWLLWFQNKKILWNQIGSQFKKKKIWIFCLQEIKNEGPKLRQINNDRPSLFKKNIVSILIIFLFFSFDHNFFFPIWSFNVVLIEVFRWWFVSIYFLCDYFDFKKYFVIGLMVAFYKSSPLLLFERNWKWED
jgi:hypothetical protein